MPDPNVRLLHHDLMNDLACSWPLDSFSPHHPFCFVDILQDGKRSVLREPGSESFGPGVIAHHHIQGDLYIVIRLRFDGLSYSGLSCTSSTPALANPRMYVHSASKWPSAVIVQGSRSGSLRSPSSVLLPSSMKRFCQVRSILVPCSVSSVGYP